MSNETTERPTVRTGQVDLTLTDNGALEVTGDTPWSGRWVRDKPTEAGVPAGWDRIEGGVEDPDWTAADEAAERAERLLEIQNDRADLDLQRERLAHERVVVDNELRITALRTAREIAEDHKFMTPQERAAFVEAQYRRFLGLLEELDPAGAEDGQTG